MIKIFIFRKNESKLILSQEETEAIVAECFKECGVVAKNIFLNVSYIDRKTMAQLNNKFCKQNHATNVLSFEPNGFDRKLLYDANNNTEVYFGDIALCEEIIEEEAKKLNISIKERSYMLVVHGLLHLCGYDHDKYFSEKQMYEVQNRICLKFGIKDPYRYNVYDVKDDE